MKKLLLVLALLCMIVLPIFSQTGSYTTHGNFYLPEYGAFGVDEWEEYNRLMQVADNQIEANKTSAGGTVTTSGTPIQYDYARFANATTIEGRSYSEMKTDLAYQLSGMSDVGATTPTNTYVLVADGDSWESRALVEVDISDLGAYLEDITGESIGSLSDVDLTDIADTKILKYNNATSKWECEDAVSGYTNLTSFVDQTAWRLFYSNTGGDVIELALGADGTYLGSTGVTSAPAFSTPSGAGDMLKSVYDTDADNDIDVAAGGTEKSSWTLYAIPYLSGTTAFGEIAIGTAEYALTINAGATGYDWTLFNLSLYYLKTEVDTQGEMETIWGDTLMNDLIDDPAPELGGEMDAGAHSIGFTQQTITYNVTTTIVDWTAGNKATVTLTGNVGTLAFTNPTNPCNMLLKIVQDATGSRLITAYDADVMWVGGTKPTLTTTANGIDICSFYWDGTNYFGVASLAFATP